MVVLVLTPAFLGDTWSELGELLASHARVLAGDGRLVPLLLGPCELPLRLDFLVPVDCTRPETRAAGIARLRGHLDRLVPPPEPERIPCPYPGMVAFGAAQAEVFFGRAGDAAFTPDGKTLAAGGVGSVIALYDIDSRHDDPNLDRVVLWDVRNRRELGAFDAQQVESLAFGPVGDVLAVGHPDRIELRDARSTGPLQTVRSPEGTTKDLSLSPDGRLLAVADGGPEVVLWDLNEQTWRRTLCQLVDRDFTQPEQQRFFPGGQAEPTCEG